MIGMGMGMSMTLRVSQALELRQAMEIQLNQSLIVEQKIMLQLTLYQEREKTLTKLYAKALKRGDVKLYQKHGMKFEYALVNKNEVPESILRECGSAFSHVLFNGFEALFMGTKYALSRGSWLLFVVRDFYQYTPPNFLEFWAVHERGEQVTLGDHNLATKLEFAIAAKEKKIRQYIKWLEKNSPDHLANVFAYQMHLELPDDDEFQKLLRLSLKTEEVQLIRQYIDEFQWPFSLLQKLSLYDKNNEKITQALRHASDTLAYFVSNSYGLEPTYLMVQQQMIMLFQKIAQLRKFLSVIRQTQEWHACLNNIADKMAKLISHLGDISLSVKEKNPQVQKDFIDILNKYDLGNDPLPKKDVFDKDISQAFDFALVQK